MHFSMRGRTVLLLTGCLILGMPAARSDNFEDGLKLFNKHDFKNASTYFDRATKDAPWDQKALYYQGLCRQYNHDFKGAGEVYKKIVVSFPGSEACTNATAALRVLDPGFLRQRSIESAASSGSKVKTGIGNAAASSASADGQLAGVQVVAPTQCKVPYVKQAEVIFVTGSVNGRATQFEFTGDKTTISAKEAASLGLGGSTASPLAAGSTILCSLKVGEILEKNFPLTVQESEHAKLGDDFFKRFTYSMDGSYLNLNMNSTGRRSDWDVRFTRVGKDMRVNITCNGRPCMVIFDQEASECVVPRKYAGSFGLDVDDSTGIRKFDAETGAGPLRGQPGYGDIVSTASASAKLQIGPVNNSEVRFKVSDEAKDARIGPSVFGGWRYDVDPRAGVIHFYR